MTTSFATLLPAPLQGGFRLADHWVWCGSVIEDDDGYFHMFASIWEKSVPFSPNWLTHSRIVRAVSPTPEGPYALAGEVLPPRGRQHWDGMMTHNPTIHRSGNTYLLYYTGTTYLGERPYGQEKVSEAVRLEARGNQRIGLATSNSPEGPWTRPAAPCLEVRPEHWDSFMTTNPAPCVAADGSILMLYKSTSSHTDPIQYGVAKAASFDQPFERIGPDRPNSFTEEALSYEDAYVWQQDDKYQMIFNDMTGKLTGEDHAGAHAVSADGIQWELAQTAKAYSRTVRWEDGTQTVQGSFERPQLLLREGKPTHLFAATADGPGHFSQASNTWNMVVPLKASSQAQG